MIIVVCVIAFFAVVSTGPDGCAAWERYLARRRARRDLPDARVVYLPSGGCRTEPDAIDALDA